MTIKFGGKEIPKSPFVVKVEEIEGDASKVIAQGPGLEQQGIIANTKTYFEVVTKGKDKLVTSSEGVFEYAQNVEIQIHPKVCRCVNASDSLTN